MRVRRPCALGAVLGFAFLVPGCGDEVKEFRSEELRPLQQRAEAQKAELAATLNVVELRSRAHARLLTSQLESIEQTFAELEELDPPTAIAADYADFTAANARFLRHMRQFIAALRQGDRRRMMRASESAKEAIGAGHEALEPLRQ